MDRNQTQTQLISAYQRFKEDFNSEGLKLEDFSPPLLLNVTDDYCRAKMRFVVYGQETTGWDWTNHLQEQYPKYPNNWRFQNQRTFADFLANNDAIESLCWGYEQFAFAQYQPKNHNSPFWQAFREIQQWPGAGVMWSNLVRVDYRGGSIFSADQFAREAILRQQCAVMLNELQALNPDVCIFLTGPDYDRVLEIVFLKLDYERKDAAPVREFARLVHAALPRHSYRTYHPSHLRQSGKWSYLNVMRTSITSTSG